ADERKDDLRIRWAHTLRSGRPSSRRSLRIGLFLVIPSATKQFGPQVAETATARAQRSPVPHGSFLAPALVKSWRKYRSGYHRPARPLGVLWRRVPCSPLGTAPTISV